MLTPLPRLTTPLVAYFSIALCAIGLCAFGAAQADAAGRYVALGDSNATGTGLGALLPDSPNSCVRTQNSYPATIAGALGISDYESAACNGAGITEFTSPQNLPYDPGPAAPQFSKLNGSETLVTITIGGNDSGYGTIVDTCLKNPNPSATPCRDTYMPGGVNFLVNNVYNTISSQLGTAIDQIHAISPNAEVWVIGYVRLIPNDVSNCVGKIGVSAGDAPVVTGWLETMNNVEKAVAEEHDAYYVDVHTASEGHDACQSDPNARWAYGNEAATPSGGSSMHPNVAGQLAAASLFVNAFHSPRPVRPVKPGPDGALPTPIGQTLGVSFRSKKVRSVRSRLAPITKTAPSKHGAKVAVKLARSGTVVFRIDRAKPGRVRNGKCRSMSRRAGKGRKACTRYVPLKSKVKLALPGGTSRVYFTGRAGGKRLSTGKYRLRATIGTLSAKTRTFKLSK